MTMQRTRTIEQEFIEEHRGSLERFKRATAAIPGGITHDVRHMKPFPLYVNEASGSKKYDVDGHEIIDYAMGHGALLLGHCHPKIVDAVSGQLQRGTHYGASHEVEIGWGERVRRLVPSVDQVEFTSSGTEATLLAMRLARAYTGREKVLKFAGHFHGWQDYAVPGEKVPFDRPTSPGIPQAVFDSVVVAPVNDLAFVDQQLAGGEIAGVILEPSGASWAAIPVPDGFLQELREFTARHNVVLIFDEVISGFRWAPGGKQEAAGVIPDLTTMAKILAGGLPGGAVGGRAEIMALLAFRDEPGWNQTKKVAHPGTYNANPLSAAAGITCLDIIADGSVQAQADAAAAALRTGFNQVLRRHGVPGFAWGESSIFHLMLRHSCANQEADIRIPQGIAPEILKSGVTGALSTALHQGMLLNGVDLFHGGGLVSVTHSPDDVEKTVHALDVTIGRMLKEGLFDGE